MSLRSADSPNNRMNMSLPGRDSVMLPDEIKSSHTDTLGIAGPSKVATPRYGKRPSHKFKFSAHFSFVWIC